MGINIDKLTHDEKKRALCLACERSFLSGLCKCATPNWVLALDATEFLNPKSVHHKPGPPGPLNPMPFDDISKKVDVDGSELAKGYAEAAKKQLDKFIGVPPEIKGTLPPGDAPALASLPFGKKAQLNRPKRGNKYHAVRSKSLITKRWYDSGAERDFADVLAAREADGLITDLVAQPVIELGPDGEIKFRADFVYWEFEVDRVDYNCKPVKTRQVWVDVKGVETERFRIIKRLWKYNGPGPLEIVKRKGKGQPFLVTQTIMPLT